MDWIENGSKFDLLKVILQLTEDVEADSHLLQDVFKQSTVSRACPSAETYTASVVWCGKGH